MKNQHWMLRTDKVVVVDVVIDVVVDVAVDVVVGESISGEGWCC